MLILLAAACGSDGEGAATATEPSQVLQPADEVNEADESDMAVRGVVGEPARLVDDLGQDITVLLRSTTVLEEPEIGRRLVVDIRAENLTDESQNSPEWELWCGDEQMPFYGGTYEWQTMPGGTFLEGTREFGYPESCSTPELRAVHLASTGESVRWDVSP
jgi:hypothetical protein